MGDMNIAPDDVDVYDPAAFGARPTSPRRSAARSPSCSRAGGLVDAYRALHPVGAEDPNRTHYTWWDYRAGELPQGARAADRPRPRERAARRPGWTGRASSATTARARSPPTTPRSCSISATDQSTRSEARRTTQAARRLPCRRHAGAAPRTGPRGHEPLAHLVGVPDPHVTGERAAARLAERRRRGERRGGEQRKRRRDGVERRGEREPDLREDDAAPPRRGASPPDPRGRRDARRRAGRGRRPELLRARGWSRPPVHGTSAGASPSRVAGFVPRTGPRARRALRHVERIEVRHRAGLEADEAARRARPRARRRRTPPHDPKAAVDGRERTVDPTPVRGVQAKTVASAVGFRREGCAPGVRMPNHMA